MQADLAQVSDSAWAVEQCLTRLAPDSDTQAALLEHGLALTARFGGLDGSPQTGDAAEGGTDAAVVEDSAVWWRCRRLELLSQLGRLRTLLILHDGCHLPLRSLQ